MIEAGGDVEMSADDTERDETAEETPELSDDAEAPAPLAGNPRAARAVRGVFAATLTLEALVVLFVPRAIAQFGSGLTAVKLSLLIALAVLFIVAAGLIRRPAGIVLGSVLQVALIACGLMTQAMFILGAIFAAIWLYELQIRRQLLGPGS
jgi:hypothetical protein